MFFKLLNVGWWDPKACILGTPPPVVPLRTVASQHNLGKAELEGLLSKISNALIKRWVRKLLPKVGGMLRVLPSAAGGQRQEGIGAQSARPIFPPTDPTRNRIERLSTKLHPRSPPTGEFYDYFVKIMHF